MPRAAARTAAFLAVSVAALSACTGPGEEADRQPTASVSTSAAAAPKPAFVPGEPASVGDLATQFDKSRETVFPETGVADVALSADRVLTAGGSQVIARSLPDLADAYAVNADTGSYVDLHLDEDARVGYALSQEIRAGEGTSLGREYYAVQRFDLESGEVTGAASVSLPQDNTGGGVSRIGWIVGVDGDRVLIGMRGDGEETDRSTAVLDLRSGKADWKRQLGNPIALAEGVAIVNTGTERKPGDVLGLDVRTGKRRWKTLVLTKTASYVGTARGRVLLVTTDGYYNLSAVNAISPRTGRTSATVKPVQVETSDMSCYPAGTGRAVCTTPDGVVEGWNLKKNTLVWSLPTRKRLAPEVSDVEDGLVYGTIGDATGVVLDARTGEDVVTNAGVAPLDVNASGGVYTFVGQALFSPVNEAG